MEKVLELVTLYADPLLLCTIACVNHACYDDVEYARSVQKQSPKSWVGEEDGDTKIAKLDIRHVYCLNNKDLSVLNYTKSGNCKLYDCNQLARFSLAKFGGPSKVGKSLAQLKREKDAEKLRKELDLLEDEKWYLCSKTFIRNGKDGLYGIRWRLKRYEEYEKLLQNLVRDGIMYWRQFPVEDWVKFNFIDGLMNISNMHKFVYAEKNLKTRNVDFTLDEIDHCVFSVRYNHWTVDEMIKQIEIERQLKKMFWDVEDRNPWFDVPDDGKIRSMVKYDIIRYNFHLQRVEYRDIATVVCEYEEKDMESKATRFYYTNGLPENWTEPLLTAYIKLHKRNCERQFEKMNQISDDIRRKITEN